jgi:hypothetical protein
MLILFGIGKSCLNTGMHLLLYLLTRKVIKLIIIIIITHKCYQLHTFLSTLCGIISVDFDVADHLLIKNCIYQTYVPGIGSQCVEKLLTLPIKLFYPKPHGKHRIVFGA